MYGPLMSPVPAGAGEPAAAISLPPLVQGPARCFLRCSVPRVLWAAPQPPAVVRLRWWGETSGGTVLQPACRAGQPAGRTSARFAVRCGPRQLAAYLADMGVLVLEVLTKLDHLLLGRAQITKLSQLSPSHPIKGSFPVVSPTSGKLGELQVSLVLEPLPELYDTSSCVLTTQGGSVAAAAQGSSKSQLPAPSQQPRHTQVTVEQDCVDNSKATSPRGRDGLLYQKNSENMKNTFSASCHGVILPDEHLKMNPASQPLSFPSSADPEALPRRSTWVLSMHNAATKDLLSALLDQGSKLRDAMVVSAMKSSPDMEIELNKISDFIERDAFKAPTKSPKGLKSSFVHTPEDSHHFGSEVSGQQLDLNSEQRAIQLLLGSADFSPGCFWDQAGSVWDSLSLGSEVYDSEVGDPHYDQSLLEKLFYTTAKSDSSLSDFLSEDDVKSSKKASKTETLKKAGPVNPQKDFHAFDQNVTETKPSCSPTAPPEDHREMALLTSLGTDRLALLQQIHLARVTIESLKIPPESIEISSRRKGLLGKPPWPLSVHKCTFFVEYHFPVRVSKDGKGQVSIATEAIRVASSKITDDVVKFQQQSVFPVCFTGTMIEHWWSSDLAFKIYMRKSTQKKAVAIGSAALQLRRVIEAELFSVSQDIPVEKEGDHTQVGPLKVSLQLAASSRDLAHVAARPAHTLRGAQLALQEPSRTSVNAASPLCSTRSPQDCQEPGASSRDMVQPLRPEPAAAAWDVLARRAPAEEDGLLLHVLLMVPDGKDFFAEGCGRPTSCNVYLNCKLLSTEEATRSTVIWGTTQPAFNFSQVMPFSLTSKHLERLKNNVMIIEAWSKLGGPGCDKLLGLVKLPLHQFYISFKDPKISHLLLQAQYPVVAVDGHVPVMDVFSGSKSGSLRVTLAMGSADQIVALQRLKTGEGMAPPVTPRPPHSLDHPATKPTVQLEPEGEDLVEHVFEIHVESVKGLTPLQSTLWGEADCYIQYYFPVQEAACGALQGPGLHEDGITLKPFRTATTLCVPDPIFNDEHHHSLLVPADVPVQRLLVSAFMAPGAAGGGIQFEVWCRYYYPNVRDHLVARGALPLSRLCAMVTLQHRKEIGIQTFNLPLVPRADSSEEFHLRSSGLLDVSVRYQRSMKIAAGITAQAVSLSVRIHRAAGLQAAARAVAQKNPSVQYYAGVGVNAYVCVLLSFLPQAQTRSTPAVPCSFCPEFEQHLEFPCHLITQKSSGETSSLGEFLQSASIFFSIYHQSTKSDTDKLADRTSRDYLLGTVTIPTRDLLTRRSGVYPLFRCNAADLAGAAMRVHISLAPTPAPTALPRLPCAEECSNSEDEGTGESPALSQQLSDKQQVDNASSGITNGEPQKEDMMFLENTVAVNILVERAMHLSLKGSPLTEREVAAPSSCVSFAVAGADAPVTTPVIGNTDSPVWDFRQQARLFKELLLDPQQTLVFKVWHKAESERVIGFASVDLSPLLSGFQLVCGWYNITDFSGQCRGQIKVAVSPLQNINHLKEERQARAQSQPESSSGKVSFPACPSNSANLSKQMLNSLSKEVGVLAREQAVFSRISLPGTQTPRHEEHMQNVRRFHKSLRQADGNAHRSAPPSSRAALLTALRKNLSELDEIQRYFSEKLTKSFPNFSTSKPSREEWESDHQGSMSREGDPKGCHLLENSSQLVSQVSSLINDLQTITKNSKEASNVHQDSSRKLGALDVPSSEEEEARPGVPGGWLEPDAPGVSGDMQQPFSAGRSVFERHMLHQLLGPIVPEDKHPVGYIQENRGAFVIQPHSEEEYEEDVVEPRALNEITTATDRTSPWSSMISETGQGAGQHPLEPRPEDQHSMDTGCFQRGNSSTLSCMLQGDSQRVLSTLSPPMSPYTGGNSPWGAAGDFQTFNTGTGTAEKEPLLPAEGTLWNRALNTEPVKKSVEFHAGSKELLPSPGDMGLTNQKTTKREEEEENAEVVNGDHQGKEGSGSDENCVRSVSAQAGSEKNSESFPDDSSEDPVEGSENLIKQKITLSDPVVIPDFFLPPEEMEASMRLLCTSFHPSVSPKSRSGALPGGIPYRRANHPRPSPELSEEEAKRIARIFSAQLSKKE
nr:C2 domain-containing protein 3 isoform X5 [Taeniopygia guttata]